MLKQFCTAVFDTVDRTAQEEDRISIRVFAVLRWPTMETLAVILTLNKCLQSVFMEQIRK